MTSLLPLIFPSASYGSVSVEFETYSHGGKTCLELYDQAGEYVTTLSTNLPEFNSMLGKDEFFAKTWSENEEIANHALASGLFLDTGRNVQVNWITAPIWKLRR